MSPLGLCMLLAERAAATGHVQLKLLKPDGPLRSRSFRDLPVIFAQGAGASAVGKGPNLPARQASAFGEWVERRTLYTAVPEKHASARELGASCLAPPSFGLDLASELPGLVRPYDQDATVGWIPVESLGGERRWLHQPGWDETGFCRPTSNGAAVGRSYPAALAAAVAELLERHAFVAWWYGLACARPLAAADSLWIELSAWFAADGWELRAYLLPRLTCLPVVLAVALRHRTSGVPDAAIVGLGTGSGGDRPLDQAAGAAALEIVQALDSFALRKALRRPVTGDLAAFLTPVGASAIDARLRSDLGTSPHPDEQWLGSPLDAARAAGLTIWISSRPCPVPHPGQLWFVQVFSPGTLPFPSTGRGRRLDHPVLRERLRQAGRTLSSVPPLPHPLG
ncbi:MAG TPA: YcaO-like family protein [Streptosporangiaceae bacterium]|nr:YcaO-like family protein [Streptosporangiaceae bacterium]